MKLNFTAHAQGLTKDWITIDRSIGSKCVAGPDDDVATIQGIQCLITNLLAIIAPIITLIAIGMIILGGAKMIANADNPKAVDEAKKIITFAIIGVIGIAAAWIILVLIQEFTGAPVTRFQIITNP
ncbi:MAG: hypothetical protein BWY29_00816 [Microgenomates group bacterium ADurb.Bin238]|jgi:hypothetical protein|nr:MAG: hypothetical protein BWY29_00816 [Microgenomates group bacterium ADurb.Bin238]